MKIDKVNNKLFWQSNVYWLTISEYTLEDAKKEIEEYEDWLVKIRSKYLKEMLDNWAEEWALFSRPSEVMIEIEHLLDNKIKC